MSCRHAPVVPIRPGVRRQEKRSPERRKLDGDDYRSNKAQAWSGAVQQPEPCEVGDERGGEKEKKQPRVPSVEQAAVPRHYRRRRSPRNGCTRRHEPEHSRAANKGCVTPAEPHWWPKRTGGGPVVVVVVVVVVVAYGSKLSA